jgi:hypothetical protein
MKAVNTLFIPMGFLLLCCTTINAQTEEKPVLKKEIQVERLTKMEQFEPTLVLPAEKRLQQKKERYAAISKQKKRIDTLQISDRKKKQLLQLIYTNPHSDRLANLADTALETDIEK